MNNWHWFLIKKLIDQNTYFFGYFTEKNTNLLFSNIHAIGSCIAIWNKIKKHLKFLKNAVTSKLYLKKIDMTIVIKFLVRYEINKLDINIPR